MACGGLPRLGQELALEHDAAARESRSGRYEGQEMVGQAKARRGCRAERTAEGKGLRAAAEPSQGAQGGLPQKRPLLRDAPGMTHSGKG